MRSWKNVTGLALGTALIAGACGGGGAGGPGSTPGGGGAPVDPGASPVRTTIVDQETPPQSYPWEGGRYRVAWTTTREDCPEGLTIKVTKVDVLRAIPQPSPFEYNMAWEAPAFNTLLQRVPPGIYTVEQTDPSCTTWQIRADRVGN